MQQPPRGGRPKKKSRRYQGQITFGAPSAQTLYAVTFKNADHVICRLKTFQRLSMAFRTKHKLLSMAHKALSHLAASSPTLLVPSLLPSFRFLNHQVRMTKFSPATGPLHCWFPLPGLSSPRSARTWFLLSFRQSVKAIF